MWFAADRRLWLKEERNLAISTSEGPHWVGISVTNNEQMRMIALHVAECRFQAKREAPLVMEMDQSAAMPTDTRRDVII